MKNKLLYPAMVLLNLLAVYVMINFYSADYLYSNVDGADLKVATKSYSLLVIAILFANLIITAVLLYVDRIRRD